MKISRVFEKFNKFIARHNLIRPGDRILVAYSGGQDSSALLALLLELRREIPVEIGVAHFNHKLRPSSDEEALLAASVAAKYKLPFFTASRNVRLHARRRRLNLEEAARELRYDFLKKAAREVGATKIATGHTLTDQAETVLMRLVRGTGLQGLTGMAPLSEGILIRPLLDLERREIETYLRRRGIPYLSDETNMNRRFLRNRIRLDLIPALEKIEPSAVRSIGRLAGILRDEEQSLQRIVETIWRETALLENKRISLAFDALLTLPPALARRVIRRFLAELQGSLRGLSFDDVESILKLREGRIKIVKKGLVVKREGDRLFRANLRRRSGPFETRWNGRGTLILPNKGGAFEASILKKKNEAGDCSLPYDNRKRAFLDRDTLSLPFIVRSRQPGDRYRPCGSPGSKKIKEILRAKKIPLCRRDDLPLFFSGRRLVWVPGLPVSEDHKVAPETKTILKIEKVR